MPKHQTNEGKMLELFLKALADESRLRIVGLLAAQEYNVGQLAEILGLTEPTLSHHLAKLREVGLVQLRANGNNRYYRVHEETLLQFKRYAANIENVKYLDPPAANDTRWMDALNLNEWERKVLETHTYNGKLRQIPTGKKFQVVLRWLASQFEAGRIYREREVNEIIGRINEDIAGLRRDLIDFGYLKRESNGSAYWLAEEQPA